MRVVDPTEHWRFALGFLLAPAPPCLIIAVCFLEHGPRACATIFLTLMLSSLAISMLFGMPLYFLISRFTRVGLAMCLSCGGIIALLLCALIFLGHAGGGDVSAPALAIIGQGHYGMHDLSAVLRGCGGLLLLGLGSALCFWLLALRGRRQ